MKQILKKIYNFGVNKSLPEDIYEKQRNINLICLISIACCLILLGIVLPMGEKPRIISLIVTIFAFIVPIIINVLDKVREARLALMVIAHLVILMYGVLYGSSTEIEYFFVTTPITAVLLTQEKKVYYSLLILSIFCFTSLKLSYFFITPMLTTAYSHIPFTIGLTIIIFGYFSTQRFKVLMENANRKKEEALAEVKKTNAKLKQKEQQLEKLNKNLQEEAVMRQVAMQALEESEKRYQTLFEHGFEGIMIADLKTNKAISHNPKLLDFFGMTREELQSINLLDLLAIPSYEKKKRLQKINKEIEAYKKSGKTQFQAVLKTHHGQRKATAEVTAVLLPPPNEHLSIAIFKDITEQMAAQKKILAANENLKNFAHAASHDLKEPLRMIQSFGQLLQRRNKGKLDTSSQEFLGFIIDASSRMNQLIQDLLEYSTTGTQETPVKTVDLNNTLFMVQNNLRLKMAETHTQIIADQLPTVKAHSSLMSQLFQNIIANGIKFQQPGIQPEINIQVEEMEEHVQISIADNGIGIAPEYHQQIFGVFKRLHSKSEYEGSGIGLATCRKIIEAYNGKIWVESEIGKGTTFFFTLPKSMVLSKIKQTQENATVNVENKLVIV